MTWFRFVLLNICLTSVISQECNTSDYTQLKDAVSTNKGTVKFAIADSILSQYGDVTALLKKLIDNLNNEIKLGNENIGESEKSAIDFAKKSVDIEKKNDYLLQKFNILKDQLSDLNNSIVNFSNTDIEETIIPIDELLKQITLIQSDLENWNKLLKTYDNKKLVDDMLNIPYEVSEELAFIEKLLDKDTDISCLKDLQLELKELFRELASLLYFDDILNDVKNLKEAAKQYKESSKEETAFVKEIIAKEKKGNDLLNRAELLYGILEDIKALGSDITDKNLNSTNVEEVIEASEKDLEYYLNKINCYSNFLSNCHVKLSTDNTTTPECILTYCEDKNSLK